MKHGYIVFISFILVIMFIIMSFSGITTQQNSQNNNINTPDILPLYGEVVNKWCLSGKTCTPSKASIGSTVTLKIDVTSFSESSIVSRILCVYKGYRF